MERGRKPRRLTIGGRAPTTVGNDLAAVLVNAGVTHAFTVPGESFLALLDALHDSPIRLVATRHEAGAGFMAEAIGQLTGRPAALLVTRAVGTANASIALHTARQNSTPLIAICGQVPTAFRGREAFQEADLATTFGALCKSAAEVADPGAVRPTAERLVALAVAGRPGPVLISIPEDVLGQIGAGDSARKAAGSSGGDQGADRRRWHPGNHRDAPVRADASAVLQAMRLLCTARRPVILAGAGIRRSGALDALGAFVRRLGIPVIAAWRRPDVFPNDDALYLGMAGLSGPPSVRARLEAADTILAIGTRISEITTYGYALPATSTTLIHVDVEPVLPGRSPAAVAIECDARDFLEAAMAVVDDGRVPEALGRAEERRTSAAVDRSTFMAETTLREPRAGPRVDPAAVVHALRAELPAGTILTTDAGNFAGWAARYLPLPPDGRFLGPTSGAMGYALPAAFAASLVEPSRPVVALAGDGGFAMLMAELETAVRERAHLTVLVFDNEMYGTIRMHQEDAHPGRVAATDLGPIDFAGIARACGANGVTVETNDAVRPAVREAIASGDVSVVHLNVDPRYLSVDRLLDEPPPAS